VFFADQGGEIVEAHVDALSGALETLSLASIAAEASEPSCEAPTSCGCFHACVEVVRLGPTWKARATACSGRTVVSSSTASLSATRARAPRVCDAAGACVDALSQVEETCTGSCAPADAPFHCVRGPSGCERVDH